LNASSNFIPEYKKQEVNNKNSFCYNVSKFNIEKKEKIKAFYQ